MRVRGDTSFSNALVAENRFVVDGIAEILPNLDRIYYPKLVEKG